MSWDPELLLSERARRVAAPAPAPATPALVNFDQGLPAHETFPLDDLRRIAADVLDRDRGWALEYISFEPAESGGYTSQYAEMALGNTHLRSELARWIGGLNGRPELDAGNVIVTSGAVQAIALAAAAFVDPGDGVLVEELTFPYAPRYFTMLGGDVRSVRLDHAGLDVADLERQLRAMAAQGVRPKLLYTIPTFHLPTGTCLALERRRRLLELAEEWDLCVLEDCVYADLRYDGDPVASLLELDASGRVLQVHAFSKIVAPGLRLGWATGSERAVACLARVRTDLGVSQWLARIMAQYMAEGLLGAHIGRANVLYRERRDLLAACLGEHLGEEVSFEVPAGGFYLWVELLRAHDGGRLREQAAADGVLYRPGETFGGTGERHFLRLAYSHTEPEHMAEGIARLARAIRRSAR